MKMQGLGKKESERGDELLSKTPRGIPSAGIWDRSKKANLYRVGFANQQMTRK